MTKCCNHHDRCYDTCGNKKNDCDEQFQSCLSKICRDVQKTLGISESVQGKCEKAFLFFQVYPSLFGKESLCSAVMPCFHKLMLLLKDVLFCPSVVQPGHLYSRAMTQRRKMIRVKTNLEGKINASHLGV